MIVPAALQPKGPGLIPGTGTVSNLKRSTQIGVVKVSGFFRICHIWRRQDKKKTVTAIIATHKPNREAADKGL